MPMSRHPEDDANEQQLKEALVAHAFAEKTEEQKKHNHLVNITKDIHAFIDLVLIIQQYEETREKALETVDNEERKHLEEKAAEYQNSMRAFYAEKKAVAETLLADYDKKNVPEKIQSLDQEIQDIITLRNEILDSWTSVEDKKIWKEGMSLKEAVTAQAIHYAKKSDPVVLTTANENIATIEQQGILLSPEEKEQLTAAREKALEIFKEQFKLLQQSELENPEKSTQRLQLGFAHLIMNTNRQMNEVSDRLNKTRPKESQIPRVALDVAKSAAYANSVTETDIPQIKTNMHFFMLLEALDNQEKALNQTKSVIQKRTSAAATRQITHCEIKAAPSSPYDSDKGSRFALQPDGSNHYSILKKVCDAINLETRGEKLTIQQNGRNIEFGFNQARFYFDPRSNQFVADNINREAFQMMMHVYNRIYRGSDMQINCDAASKNLCESNVSYYNKANPESAVQAEIKTGTEKLRETPTEKIAEAKEQEMQAAPARRV
ncbi:MAG TPA: hypothetical protein VLJ15_03285 [Gammaproteobacteria bacterium]|nr:hypothetical protein [Gammaproteobacteria bacterium]